MRLGVMTDSSGVAFVQAAATELATHEVTAAGAYLPPGAVVVENPQALFSAAPEAILLCAGSALAAEWAEEAAARGIPAVLALSRLPSPEEAAALLPHLERGTLHAALPQLFLPHVAALARALQSGLVAAVGTVNSMRTLPHSCCAWQAVLEDILIAVSFLGEAQEMFAQRQCGGGRESVSLMLRPSAGALVSLCAQTGVGGQAGFAYTYACRDGVIEYDSRSQPLVLRTDNTESDFPGVGEGYGDACVLATREALTHLSDTGERQTRLLRQALTALCMAKESVCSGRAVRKGAAACETV